MEWSRLIPAELKTRILSGGSPTRAYFVPRGFQEDVYAIDSRVGSFIRIYF